MTSSCVGIPNPVNQSEKVLYTNSSSVKFGEMIVAVNGFPSGSCHFPPTFLNPTDSSNFVAFDGLYECGFSDSISFAVDTPGGKDAGAGKEGSALSEWVSWYVETYEAWEQVPAGWAEHTAMVNELQAAMELRLAIDAETAGEMLASARGRADWHDYRGRLIERLAAGPGATCAQQGGHRDPRSWDREGSAERRRRARQTNRARVAG